MGHFWRRQVSLVPSEILPLDHPACISMQKWQDIKVDLKNKMGGCGLDSSGSGPRDMIGSCDHGNELPGSIKCMELN